jgi:hypothetical protein
MLLGVHGFLVSALKPQWASLLPLGSNLAPSHQGKKGTLYEFMSSPVTAPINAKLLETIEEKPPHGRAFSPANPGKSAELDSTEDADASLSGLQCCGDTAYLVRRVLASQRRSGH